MIVIDPAEEIRRLVEDEDIPEAEARARVREDLRQRREALTTPRRTPKAPMNLQWTPGAASRGNAASRRVRSRKTRT